MGRFILLHALLLYYINSSVWNAGILLYEMLYGRTPFRGKNRQKTFSNILNKDLTFPSSIPVKSVSFDIIKTVFCLSILVIWIICVLLFHLSRECSVRKLKETLILFQV